MFKKRILLNIPKRYFALDTLEEAFEHAHVVPDVISRPPRTLLTVKYDSYFRLANVMCPRCVDKLPTLLNWDGLRRRSLYVVLMLDPDAPSREEHTSRFWQHWAVVNVPGNNYYRGNTISEYIGAAPGDRTGLHRYVFLVFKQKTIIDISKVPHLKNDNSIGRANFSICRFMREHDLEETPEAGTFFYAKYDDSVKALKGKLEGGNRAIEDAKYA